MGLGPQRLQTPRTQAEDLFSQLLSGQPPQTQDPFERRFPGQVRPGAQGAQGGVPDILRQLASGNLPSFQGPFGVPLNQLQTSILGGLGGASPDILSAIQSIGTGGTDVTAGARGPLEVLAGGGALEDVFASLDEARRFGLGRDVRDIREQFSASGLRDTPDLARAIGVRQAESEAGQQARFGELGLQNLGQRTQAAGLLGQLGLGSQAQQLQALMGLPGVAGGLFGIGEQARQVEEAPLLRMLQEFQRTQGANLPLLLQFLMGTPQIVGPGAGSQLLSAGATVGGGLAAASSRRWKRNIEPIEDPIDTIARLRGVRFNWRSDGRPDVGLIAEDVAEVLPEVVVSSNGAPIGIEYGKLVAVLVEAVKAQQRQIDELKAAMVEAA